MRAAKQLGQTVLCNSQTYRTHHTCVRYKHPWTCRDTHPAKKALKGKLVTKTQYTNCMTPESMMNTRKASINLSLSDVFCMYDFHMALTESAIDDSDAVDFGALTLVILWSVGKYCVGESKQRQPETEFSLGKIRSWSFHGHLNITQRVLVFALPPWSTSVYYRFTPALGTNTEKLAYPQGAAVQYRGWPRKLYVSPHTSNGRGRIPARSS